VVKGIRGHNAVHRLISLVIYLIIVSKHCQGSVRSTDLHAPDSEKAIDLSTGPVKRLFHSPLLRIYLRKSAASVKQIIRAEDEFHPFFYGNIWKTNQKLVYLQKFMIQAGMGLHDIQVPAPCRIGREHKDVTEESTENRIHSLHYTPLLQPASLSVSVLTLLVMKKWFVSYHVTKKKGFVCVSITACTF